MDDAGKGSTAATVCTAVLAVATLGLIGVCAAVIFHFSPHGTGYVIGEWLGAFLVALLIASLVMRRDSTRPWRVPIALAVALLVLLVSRVGDVRASIEDVKAQKILAAVTSLDELDKVIKENPDNALMRTLGATMAAKRESGRRLQKLLEDYDDKDLPVRLQAGRSAD